jgi:hypothetical protein
MLETMVAMMVLSLVATSAVAGLSGARTLGAGIEAHSIAENIGRNQMEYVFSLPFQEPTSVYPSIADLRPGYGVSAVAEEFIPGDSNIEKLVVTVTGQGRNILVLETLRARE